MWSGSDPRFARAGLIASMALWFYTLVLPSALGGSPADWGLLDPQALFGVRGLSPLTHGVLWSLGANLLIYGGGLLQTRPFRGADPAGGPRFGAVTSLDDLCHLTARFVGPDAAREAFAGYRARAIIASGLSGSSLGIADVVRLLDDTNQSMLFSKGLLAATLENMDAGVSVVDKDLRLLAWNGRYAAMFDYSPSLTRVGTPVADLIRYNALHGECGPGEVDAHVERRLAHMGRREPHVFERRRPDGTVLKTVGGPMPGDGYIMSFIDVSAERAAQDALAMANAGLEMRVAERTAELIAANAGLERVAVELETARRQAEAATRDKTQFLAAASHDLLQPLHAARLFCAALSDDLTEGQRPLAANIDQSPGAADRLLRSLLDVSQLDAEPVRPHTPPAHDTKLWARRVLCVDDDPRILAGLAALLGAWGCEIVSASDYAGAIMLVEQEPIDLALIDYQLGRMTGPGETGLDLIEVLGARQPGAVAALVTADPSAKIAQKAARLGAQVLRKSVDALALRELVVRRAVAAEQSWVAIS